MRKITFGFIILLFIPLIVSAQSRVKARDILEQIDRGKVVKYENVEIVGELDFTTIKEITLDKPERRSWGRGNSTRTYWCHVRVPLSFINCVFRDDVHGYVHDDWKNETHNAVFYENVDFTGCEFQGESTFKYVKFLKHAKFENTTFHEEAFFKYTNFSTPIRFTKAYFHDGANFKYTKFPEDTYFEGAQFRRQANFKYTKFWGNASFENAVFRRDAVFGYTEFTGNVNFNGAEFEDDADFRYTKVDGEDFTIYLLNKRKVKNH